MIYKKYFLLIILIIFTLSCSSSQLGWKSEPQARDHEKKYVEDFDPLSLEEDFEILEDKEEENKQQDALKSLPKNTEKKSPTVTEEVSMQGYRVQLLATSREDLARKAKQKAIYKIQENVYLDFESSLWKIRVGNCQTLKEAEELRDKVRRIGRREGESEWANAWIVPSRIMVERTIKR